MKVSKQSAVRGYLKSFLILNFAPLAPQLWGEQESICFYKSPKIGGPTGLGCSKWDFSDNLSAVSSQRSAVSGQLSCFKPVWSFFLFPIKLRISFAFCLLPLAFFGNR
ncbi:hypothetical protein BJP37_31115 [Moorena bouillonii PNG]|uniref:Uncharacterized protein n=1 Tax=Moorena bouillonii PNG TaxID=568701 RepID=A0A1U7NA53_9CYAN|nr:hypothetical protein BJP37_31115 [Moorena bouillonii PNG]